MTVEHFRRDFTLDVAPSLPTLLAKNLTHQRITADGKTVELREKGQSFTVQGGLSTLILNDIS